MFSLAVGVCAYIFTAFCWKVLVPALFRLINERKKTIANRAAYHKSSESHKPYSKIWRCPFCNEIRYEYGIRTTSGGLVDREISSYCCFEWEG